MGLVRGRQYRAVGMNLLDKMPPLVNIEQAYDGFTHDPKGRRLKLAVSYNFGG